MNYSELNSSFEKPLCDYVTLVLARRHRVSLPVASLIAEIQNRGPVADPWRSLGDTANSIVGRAALSISQGERS